MFRRAAYSLARAHPRPLSTMASETPVEDTIREKVRTCFGNRRRCRARYQIV